MSVYYIKQMNGQFLLEERHCSCLLKHFGTEVETMALFLLYWVQQSRKHWPVSFDIIRRAGLSLLWGKPTGDG